MTADGPTSHGDTAAASIRLDKWLWFARFFKSRSLATKFLDAGKVRIRGAVAKTHVRIHAGDVVTFTLGGAVRIIEVRLVGTRRGPASEARTLYADLSPPRPERASPAPASFVREPGAGRPTKTERRALDRLRGEGDA